MAPKTYQSKGAAQDNNQAQGDAPKAKKTQFYLKIQDTLNKSEDFNILTALTVCKGKKDVTKTFMRGNTIVRDESGSPVKQDGDYVIDQSFLLDVSELVSMIKRGEI